MREKGTGRSRRDFRVTSDQLTAFLPEADADLLVETLVAFANADGGTIYLGVTEGGELSGDLYPEELSDLKDQALSKCRPPIVVEWEPLEVAGAFAFVGQVHRSSTLYTTDDGRVLVRTGTENRSLSGEEVQQLVSTRSSGDYETEPVPGASRADLDDEVLAEFREMWEERQGRQLTRPLDDLLREMGYLTPDGQQPTVAGILLFGKNPTAFLPRSGVTFVRFEGEKTHKPGGEAGYGRRVEIKGPLARTIKRMYDILKEELHVGAVVKGLRREEQWTYPPVAVREALVNAVAHRDYQMMGRAIEVRLYKDHMEFISPGKLPGYITVDNIIEEHFSRNPRIVNGLYQWGFIEELGMGIDVMIEEMANAGHPSPRFHEGDGSFTVTFEGAVRRRPKLPPGTDLTMNERQAKALHFIEQHQRIRSRDYQELCPDVSPETLRLDLVDLCERGILLKIGRKRGTYYILK